MCFIHFLLIKASTANSSAQSRLEKADILELTVVHLKALEKEKEEFLQLKQQQQLERVEKESNSVDSEIKSYRLGYQACYHDITRFLDDPTVDLSKERLIEHLQNRKQKMFQPSQGGGDPDLNVITPTRLSDGRLALVFSSSCSWLSGGIDLPFPSSSFNSNPDPATPPSSPDQQVVPQPSADVAGCVWRPWF